MEDPTGTTPQSNPTRGRAQSHIPGKRVARRHPQQTRKAREQATAGCEREDGPKLKKHESMNPEIKDTSGPIETEQADKQGRPRGKLNPQQAPPKQVQQSHGIWRKTKQKRPEKKEKGKTPSP